MNMNAKRSADSRQNWRGGRSNICYYILGRWRHCL